MTTHPRRPIRPQRRSHPGETLSPAVPLTRQRLLDVALEMIDADGVDDNVGAFAAQPLEPRARTANHLYSTKSTLVAWYTRGRIRFSHAAAANVP